jgi:DNA-binding NarL/FixJ family response regulator
MRILLADDSGLILERMQEMLKKINHVEITGSYTNGIDTLNALRTLSPDLAIVDLKMPGLNGIQVLNEIRNENKILKFMILTFCSADYYQKLAIQAGADYYFSKVDDFEKVSMVVEEMLANEKKYAIN